MADIDNSVNDQDWRMVLKSPRVRFKSGEFTQIVKGMAMDPNITGDELKLWIAIHEYAGDNRGAYPSHAKLSEGMGKSVPTVKRIIESLEEKNLLDSEYRKGTSKLYWNALPSRYARAFELESPGEGDYVPELKGNVPLDLSVKSKLAQKKTLEIGREGFRAEERKQVANRSRKALTSPPSKTEYSGTNTDKEFEEWLKAHPEEQQE